MAPLAIRGRRSEIHMEQTSFHVRRLVAICACDRAMRSDELKSRGGVIELAYILPRIHGVTGETAVGLPISASLLHAFGKLFTVGILMAARAGQVREAECGSFDELNQHALLMAVSAGDGNVGARELESRLLVLGEREGGRVKSIDGVTIFAPVEVRGVFELLLVRIAMAIRTLAEFDFVYGRFFRRDMTLGAHHRRMLALKWITRLHVLRNAKFCGLPAFNRVT